MNVFVPTKGILMLDMLNSIAWSPTSKSSLRQQELIQENVLYEAVAAWPASSAVKFPRKSDTLSPRMLVDFWHCLSNRFGVVLPLYGFYAT